MPRHFSKMRTRYNTLDSWGIWTPESSAWASHSLPALLLHCASWASGSFAFLNCIALNCIFKPTQEPWSQKKNNASFKIALWSVKCSVVFQTCSNHQLVDPLWSRCSQPKAATFFLQSSACNLFPSATSGYVGYVSFPMESSVSLQCLNGLLLLCTEGTCLILLAWTTGITREECRGKSRKGEKDCEKTLDPTTAMTKF